MKNFASFICVLILLSALFSEVVGQEKPVTISMVRNADKTIEFRYVKNDPGTYTIGFNFSELTNVSIMSIHHVTVRGLTGIALKLKPITPDQHINIGSYRYSYIRGKLNPQYDPSFIYMLPYSEGVEVTAIESTYLNATYFGNSTPPDWKYYGFYTAKQEKVKASRRGLVVDVKDVYDTDSTGSIHYSNKTNEVMVEHDDGTLARYSGFQKGSISVKLGQTVYPGSELGLNTRRSNMRYSIHLGVYYLISKDFEAQKGQTLQTVKSMYGFVNPRFATKESPDLNLENRKTYQVFSSKELISKEMTKKEIKNL